MDYTRQHSTRTDSRSRDKYATSSRDSNRDHKRSDRDKDRDDGASSNTRRCRSPKNDKADSEREHKRHRKHSRDRSEKRTHREKDEDLSAESGSDEDDIHSKLVKLGANPISSDDYFQRAPEFKAWLMSGAAKSSGKKLYLDEMSGKESRRYFDRFVKAWNRGQLIDAFYLGEIRTSASAAASQTRHKWNFTSNSTYTEKERELLESTRDSVDTLTNSNTKGAIEARELEKKLGKGKRMTERDGESSKEQTGSNTINMGPSRGDSGWNRSQSNTNSSSSDLRYEREVQSDLERVKRIEDKKRENRNNKEEREELNPRSTGRDAVIEKRRNLNSSNREFAERKREDDGLDLDDGLLMGGGDDFASALASRDKTKNFKTEKRSQKAQDRAAVRDAEKSERFSTLKAKESDTMEMFKQLAAQRFGGQ